MKIKKMLSLLTSLTTGDSFLFCKINNFVIKARQQTAKQNQIDLLCCDCEPAAVHTVSKLNYPQENRYGIFV